jgi:uncharacterized iron-regulated membrane protein
MKSQYNTQSSVTVQGQAGGLAANRFYRVVWRWHFYAGLFVVPFMAMLAVTGAIYLFKPQLDGWMYRDRMFVQPASTARMASEQVAAVNRAYPGGTVNSYSPPSDVGRSAEVSLSNAKGRKFTVFVDPHTARVLGERDEENNLQTYALELHGELMLGPVGDLLVELAACWGLVLLFSGLYLWWPRRGFSVWGTFLPRFGSGGRVFWRDLHAVPGVYGSLLVGFLILTGLPWAGFWGTNFARIWERYPEQKFAQVPKSSVPMGSLNSTAVKVVPWAVEQMPLPQSGHEGHGAQGISTEAMAAHGIDLDRVVALAQAKEVTAGYTVRLPVGPQGVYTISVVPDDPTKQRTLHVDRYTGAVLADVGWGQYGPVPRAVETGISLHEGKYFGLPNQLVGLFACLVAFLLPVSGGVMWWKRRPSGRLGAPVMPRDLPLWKGAVAIMTVLGLLFPLVGVSLLAVLLLDYLVLSRVSFLKQLVQ